MGAGATGAAGATGPALASSVPAAGAVGAGGGTATQKGPSATQGQQFLGMLQGGLQSSQPARPSQVTDISPSGFSQPNLSQTTLLTDFLRSLGSQ